MIFHKKQEEYNSSIQECSEYSPIQSAQIGSLEFDAAEIEDSGCDSCSHCHNGECEVFRSNNKDDTDY